MLKIFKWLDGNILAVLAGFLLVFIPLYPKWPLFDILTGYNVRVRAEDFLVAATIVVFGLQLLRRKVQLHKDWVSAGIIGYLVIGFLSVVTSIFIVQTVPLQFQHVAKTVLHWLRRIEYMSLFFVFFSSIRSLKIAKTLIFLFFVTLGGVIIYGLGQKYLYWPAFSTMNREFAKGWWLYLTAHARVLSTFGGHYDLAAYLVIALTLGWSFFFGLSNKVYKLAVGLLVAGGFWLLVLTASRVSFVAYLIGLSAVVFLWTFKRGVGWGFSRWLTATFLSLFIMLSFGDLSDRFLTLIRASERFSGIRNILLNPSTTPPKDQAMFLVNNLAAVTSKSDQPPTPIRPADVTGSEEPLLVASKSATGATILVPKQRNYSQNALMFDLSTSIRLDATWPQAVKGFLADPILGSGYATLTKTSKYEFTEAESTDNDYLRALGETGLLGIIFLFGTIGLSGYFAFKLLGGAKDLFTYSLIAGFVGLTIGLLVNAVLIDVYESSKVAYMFWGLSGLVSGTLFLEKNRLEANREPLRIPFNFGAFKIRVGKFLREDLLWVGLIVLLSFLLRTYKLHSPIADWHSWRQADTSAVTRNYLKQDRINFLYPVYDDISSVASGKFNPMGYRFVEFPLYNAATVVVDKLAPELGVEAAGRITTDLMYSLALVFLFLICLRLINRRVAYFSALVFALIPYGIYYGRTILPDPSMLALSLGAIYFTTSYIANKRIKFLALMGIFAAGAYLVKPYAIFLLLPVVYLWYAAFHFDRKQWAILILTGLVSVTPFALWRLWILRFPEGIPASSWLLNGNGIRFKGAFWFWLFADRIGRLILGYWGLVLLGFGLVRRLEGKFRLFPVIFLLSSILYLFVFATGNVQHDYYQILLLPSLAIFVGLGLDSLLFSQNGPFSGLVAPLLGILSFLFMLGFGWYFVRDLFNINHPEIVKAGEAVQTVSNDHELVIAPYDGDTAFLYQTGRRGWPIVEGSIEDMISRGADFYVSVKFDDLTNRLIAQSATKEQQKLLLLHNRSLPPYTLITRADRYVVIQLVPDLLLPKP